MYVDDCVYECERVSRLCANDWKVTVKINCILLHVTVWFIGKPSLSYYYYYYYYYQSV